MASFALDSSFLFTKFHENLLSGLSVKTNRQNYYHILSINIVLSAFVCAAQSRQVQDGNTYVLPLQAGTITANIMLIYKLFCLAIYLQIVRRK